VQAEIKAGWIHIKFDDINGYSKWQRKLCEQLDYVIAVSEDSRRSFIDAGVRESSVKVIHNIMSPDQIRKLAQDEPIEQFDDNTNNILTVARLSYHKGIDIIIKTAKYLRESGLEFRWYIVGDLANCGQYEQLAKQYGVDGYVAFMGATNNPYCYINKCDVYVQPSRSEGWGMSITEAKILQKPIVASDLAVFKEQITDGENGLIRPLDEVELGKAIILVLRDKELKKHICKNLALEKLGNVEEVDKIYELIRK
jgi:glycosyltransferase involved in cell wall biosynthesis